MPDNGTGTGRGRPLRIASWNVLYGNDACDRIGDFLDATDADIAALQELSQPHLDHIEALGRWHVIRSVDQTGPGGSTFLGIVSKVSAISRRVVDLASVRRPRRSPYAHLTASSATQSVLSAQFAFDGKPLQVMNVHLTCATSPEGRRQERAAAIQALAADAPAVILGDFNAMARRWISAAFAIPFRYGPRDLWFDELAEVTEWAAGLGFVGSVDGVTFPRLGLQLDQAFVRGTTVASAHILKRRFGSDHRPVVVDLVV